MTHDPRTVTGRDAADVLAEEVTIRIRRTSPPPRLWEIAAVAVDHGWQVMIGRSAVSGKGWRLVISDDHHCLHINWHPGHNGPWSLRPSTVGTRCPKGLTVHVKDLGSFLRLHPARCLPTHNRAPRRELGTNSGCEDHLVQVGAAKI